MSAVWLKIITAVSVCCTTLADAEERGVVWKDFGEAVTIQCRAAPGQDSLNLKMGLSEDSDVFFTEKDLVKTTVADRYKHRLQSNGDFPNVNILIKNLTLNDTGPYWCVYKIFDTKTNKQKSIKGDGSVLLVVTDDKRGATDPMKACNGSHQDLVLVSVVISAAVLLCILMAFLIMIILKTRSLRASVTPRRLPTNDVYEDMRGTFRR